MAALRPSGFIDISECQKERLHSVCEPSYEPSKSDEFASEALQLLLVCWCKHVSDHFHLIWIDFDSSLGNHEPQELPRAYPECAFGWVKLHAIFSQ